jgi:hypothetical protein
VERGSAGLSRSTRRDITWPNRRSDLRLGKHPLYHLGGTACVLALYTGKRRCLRHGRRLHRASARHILTLIISPPIIEVSPDESSADQASGPQAATALNFQTSQNPGNRLDGVHSKAKPRSSSALSNRLKLLGHRQRNNLPSQNPNLSDELRRSRSLIMSSLSRLDRSHIANPV